MTEATSKIWPEVTYFVVDGKKEAAGARGDIDDQLDDLPRVDLQIDVRPKARPMALETAYSDEPTFASLITSPVEFQFGGDRLL